MIQPTKNRKPWTNATQIATSHTKQPRSHTHTDGQAECQSDAKKLPRPQQALPDRHRQAETLGQGGDNGDDADDIKDDYGGDGNDDK